MSVAHAGAPSDRPDALPEPGRGKRSRASLIVIVAVILTAVVACGDTLQQVTGRVVSVDSPSFGRVDGFELLASDGRTLAFDTRELPFRPEFPAVHLDEHRQLGTPVAVTYREEGDRLVVTKLDDA